jgi:hypothetical protein
MYTTLCMALDGGFVTDGDFKTKEEAIENSANMGSKWIFYPFHFIVKKDYEFLNKRILAAGESLEHLEGKTINTARKYIKEYAEVLLD